MSEIFKDVLGYEGIYLIGSNGTVVSLRGNGTRKSSFTMKQVLDGVGYFKVNLYRKGVPRTTSVHRIVAEVFCENPMGKKFVNHKDGNQINNNHLNLEWTTHSENCRHSTTVLGRGVGVTSSVAKLSQEDVDHIRCLYVFGAGITQLANAWGISNETAASCAKGFRYSGGTGRCQSSGYNRGNRNIKVGH